MLITSKMKALIKKSCYQVWYHFHLCWEHFTNLTCDLTWDNIDLTWPDLTYLAVLSRVIRTSHLCSSVCWGHRTNLTCDLTWDHIDLTWHDLTYLAVLRRVIQTSCLCSSECWGHRTNLTCDLTWDHIDLTWHDLTWPTWLFWAGWYELVFFVHLSVEDTAQIWTLKKKKKNINRKKDLFYLTTHWTHFVYVK